MKTRIILFLCFVIAISLSSCKREKHIQYYDNGELQCIFYTKNHKPVGKWIVYYEDGSLYIDGKYRFGHEVGLWTIFYRNGDIMMKNKYLFGNLKSINAWDKDGNHVIVDGTGTLKLYYESGMPESVISYKNNVWHGENSSWYESGVKKSEQIFDNGHLMKVAKEWDENGNLSLTNLWIKLGDTLSIFCNNYNPNEQIIREIHYKGNKSYEIERIWNEAGELISEQKID